jgi:hypothetical protein
LVAANVHEDGHGAVGLLARRPRELDPVGLQVMVVVPEVVGLEEEKDPMASS